MLNRETPVLIPGPCGQLEALSLEVPDARGVALICHPNPVQGGTMLNKVVSTVQRTARDAGYHTLRFNYRGVGASAGSHDMASGEVDDAEALAGRLENQGQAVAQLFMLAPAVQRLPADNPPPQGVPLTLIQPEADEVIDPQAVYAWSAGLGRAHELLKVAECGHFFHGKLTELKDLLLPRL